MQTAARLPNGKYAKGGRAVRFSDLSRLQQHLWRVFWGKKAWKTRHKRLAEVVVIETQELEDQARRQGLRAFGADVPAGVSTHQVIQAIKKDALRQNPSAVTGSWLAKFDWPDDPASEPGQPPIRSTVSIPLSGPGKMESSAGRAAEWFREVQQAPQALSNRYGSRHGGAPRPVSVFWLMYSGKRKRRKRTAKPRS